MTFKIPFNRPYWVGKEHDYVFDVIRIGLAAGDGAYTEKCHTLLEQILNVPKVLLSTLYIHLRRHFT